jgi:hypothetical protein
VNLAVNAFLRSAPRVATLPPVLFMLDEFGNLGRLPEILNVLNISRDLRLQMWFFLQNLEQLTNRNHYPEESTSFFSGSGAITSFSARDWNTAEYFSKLLGKREVEMMSYSQGDTRNLQENWEDTRRDRQAQASVQPINLSMNNGFSRSTHIHQLIEPEDMWRLGKGGTVNIIDPHLLPVRGYAPGYWEITELAGVLDPNPYYLG